MDKLKKVFSPGSAKDDEILYGDASTRRASATAASSDQDTAKLYPTEGTEKEHGVLRQILNPGGHKHDELAHGTTATTEKPDPSTSQTTSDQKDHTIAQQILNPGGQKYDPQRFGTPGENTSTGSHATTTDTLETNPGERKHEHSVLRQIINPGGKNYDNEGYGNTAHVVGDSSSTANASQAQPSTTHTPRDQPASSGISGSQNTAGDSSHFGRDAVIAGTGVAGYEAAKHRPPTSETTRSSEPVDLTRPQHSSPLTSNTANTSQVENTRQAGNDSHLGRDAAIGAGVAGGAAAYGAHEHGNDHPKTKEETSKATPTHKSQTTSSNVDTSGSSYPSESTTSKSTPTQPSQTTSGNVATSGSSYPSQSTTNSAYNSSTPAAATSNQPTGSSHLDRDAAIGAGAGAAGGAVVSGFHHNTRDKDEFGRPVESKQGQTSSSTATASGGSYPSQHGTDNTLSSSSVPSTTGTSTGGSHLGRDAAIVGGTGLAGGAAAHELGKERREPSQTGTSGLSQSNPTTTSAYTSGSGEPSSSDGSILNRPHPLAGGTTADSTTSTMFGGPGFDRERGVHQPGQGIDTSSDGLSQNTSGTTAGTFGSQGPHSTATANQLDPHVHVPGEFPSEDGTTGTTLGNTTTPSTGAGVSGLASGYGSSQTPSNLESTKGSTLGDEKNSHTGRDLAAGAAAGAGAGALASGISSHGPSTHGSSTEQPTEYSTTSTSRTADPYATSGQTAASTGAAGLGSSQSPATRTTDPYSASGQTATSTGASGLASSQSPATHGSSYAQAPATSSATGTSGPASTSHTSTSNTTSVPQQSTAGAGHSTSQEKPKHHTAHILGGIGGPMTGATLGGRDLGEGPEEQLASGEHSKAEKHQGGVFSSPEAAAAGAGVVGVGAYEANKSRGDTGPASKTIGPHESNFANVVDPRVKPEPSQMKGQSSTAQAQPGATEKDHHHGHADEAKHEKHHNKLQKARPEDVETESTEKEKKPSLIHRILHPGEHKKEKEAEQLAASSTTAEGVSHPSSTEGATSQATDSKGRVIEPHTGLPMNVDKYGTGAGGTDGASNIRGLHQTDPAVAGPDWEAVRKANTPY